MERDKGEYEMNALAHVMDRVTPDLQETEMRTSTLYDLIEVISDETEPGEEGLMVRAVLDLLKSGRIKWVNGNRELRRI
jgi:hypothetical protein